MKQKYTPISLWAIAIVMVGLALFGAQVTGDVAPVQASALFDSPLPTVPNDGFAAAQVIHALPFHAEADTTYATLETNEPLPFCFSDPSLKSIWYAYTPTSQGSLLARAEGWNGVLAIYQGSSLNNLSALQCVTSWNQVNVQATAGVTYYFQLGSLYSYDAYVGLTLSLTPPPQASFYYSPWEPAIYDLVWFYDNSYDPGYIGWQAGSWNFGDGASSTTPTYASHQFAKDGTYQVAHTITTSDGRTGSTTNVVQVRTRDVYITKMTRPSSATVGQTKKLGITLANKRYPQNVRVDFYKSIPGGYYQIGYTEQYVAVNRKTDVYLSYTFTPADAQIGKVTIKAVATILDGRDALPADNEFISLPITVKGRNGRSAEEIAADGLSPDAVDEESNTAADGPILSVDSGTGSSQESLLKPAEQAAYRVYMPLVKQ